MGGGRRGRKSKQKVEEEELPPDPEVEKHMKERATLRLQMNNVHRYLTNQLKERSSRRAIRSTLALFQDYFFKSEAVNLQLVSPDNVAEFDNQQQIQLEFFQKLETLKEEVELQLDERKDEPESVFNFDPSACHGFGRAGSTSSSVRGGFMEDDLVEQRQRPLASLQVERRQAPPEGRVLVMQHTRPPSTDSKSLAIAAAQRRADDAVRAATEATRALLALQSTSAEESMKAEQLIKRDDIVKWCSNLPPSPTKHDDSPDAWIDAYKAGNLEPVCWSSSGGSSSVRIDLKVYSGNAVDWFTWIDLFRALVHDTNKSPGEKLALLKQSLETEEYEVIASLGGGEEAYKEALFRLKQYCGRRDVIRNAHKAAIDKLSVDKDLRRFAERVRSHLFALTRVGEVSSSEIIERVVLKLERPDQVAWNEKRGSDLETRSLEEFGEWLRLRALVYHNALSIANDQSNNGGHRSNPSSRGRASGRSFNTSSGRESIGEKEYRRASCVKCEQDHRLAECDQFKALSIKQRLSFCVQKRLCLCCFGTRHFASDCQADGCGVKDCKHIHHKLLHEYWTEGSVVKGSSHVTHTVKPKVALGTIRAKAIAADGSLVPIGILPDEASDTTLVRTALLHKLKIDGEPTTLYLEGVTGAKRYQSKRVSIRLALPGGGTTTLTCMSRKSITRPTTVIDWERLKTQWGHLEDLPLQQTGGEVDILLGMDHAYLLAVLESRHGGEYEPIASRTRLGWIVRGVIGVDRSPSEALSLHVYGSCYFTTSLEDQLRRFNDTEEFGTEFKGNSITKADRRAVDLVEKGTRYLAGGGLEVPMTWKKGEPKLTNNRKLAEHRLHSLIRRFERDPAYEKDYRTAMQKYFDEGYAVRVDLPPEGNDAFYLHHHGVYKPGTNKLRVVFDAAARFNGKSLNDALCSGPPLLNQLGAALIKFQENEVAFSADIRAMFSRIRLREEDAKYHHFLWQEAGSSEIISYRMDRLTFGTTASPFIAISTLHRVARDADEEQQEAAAAIRNKFYVDDYLDSAKTVKEAVRRATQVRDILAKGDFQLEGWKSNSKELLQAVEPGRNTSMSSAVPLAEDGAEKLLGVYWKPSTDSFTFSVRDVEDVLYTRIELTSRVLSVFDPLGKAAHVLIKARIKLRELDLKGIGWNEPLQGEDKEWWQQWFKLLSKLNEVETPRCLFPDPEDIVESQLHVFGDASEEAYGASAYVRNEYKGGKVMVRQIMAKAKLSPKKTLSIPKLELNAALLAARLGTFVREALEHKIDRAFFWTDSSTVRNWLRSTASYYKPFVSHRVGEIQTITTAEQWRHVPGIQNVSDCLTRSTIVAEPAIPEGWFEGRPFLYRAQKEWPEDLKWMAESEEVRVGRVFVTQQAPSYDWNALELGPDNLSQFLQLKEPTVAIIKACQEESFIEDIEQLKKGKPLRSTSALLPLTPVLGSDGLLRLGGRIGRAKLPYEALHPPLLPAKHQLTERIVQSFHKNMHHAGTDFLFAQIRQHLWIIHGREVVKRVRKECAVCIKENRKPAVQQMGDMPTVRLDSFTPPFTHIAVDYFGPMEVQHGRGTRKVYGALFTCLTIRAVYVDVAVSLSTPDFLNAFRRFIGVYSKPKTVHSDNGTNFVGAEKELVAVVEKLNQDQELEDFNKRRAIEWRFQPPSAPHFGGAHESMVKSTKKALYRALAEETGGLRYPTEDQLRTLLLEVSGLLNSRPLTYVSSDPDDYRALTPKDFLNLPSAHDLPPNDFTSALPRDRYRYVQKMANLFWGLWTSLYLPSLATRKKWHKVERNFAKGDFVMLVDPNQPRGRWKTGRVEEVIVGPDKLVRRANINTEEGMVERPIHRLVLLEPVSSSSTEEKQLDSGEDVPTKE